MENFLQVKHGLIIKNEYWFHYMIQKKLGDLPAFTSRQL